jgi:hypothetical protein
MPQAAPDSATFCSSAAGFWGADCALSLNTEGQVQLLAGHNYTELPGKPLIYVYELPPRFNVW